MKFSQCYQVFGRAKTMAVAKRLLDKAESPANMVYAVDILQAGIRDWQQGYDTYDSPTGDECTNLDQVISDYDDPEMDFLDSLDIKALCVSKYK